MQSASDDELNAFYEVLIACGGEVPPREQWLAHARDNAVLWPLTDRAGRVLGGVFFKGHTLHIAVHPDWHGRWITKRLLAAYRQWTPGVDIYATPPVANTAACTLARRLGLQHRGEHDSPAGRLSIFVKEATTPCPQS